MKRHDHSLFIIIPQKLIISGLSSRKIKQTKFLKANFSVYLLLSNNSYVNLLKTMKPNFNIVVQQIFARVQQQPETILTYQLIIVI